MTKKEFLKDCDPNILKYSTISVREKNGRLGEGVLLRIGKTKKQVQKEICEHDGSHPLIFQEFEILLTEKELYHLLNQIQ